ncbi:hypothetical protein [Kitasatospora sp. NPDC002040]|uniref:hypothetical protein n=1 Tax=Kitasatospora sp. NPDC002040 TaxID=3154661 RepID=UPI00331FFD6C
MSQSSITSTRRPVTTTGRAFAEAIVTITHTAATAWVTATAWIAEADGVERQRRAAVQHIAELTGTEPLHWTGEISAQDWDTVLTFGADALLALHRDASTEQSFDLDLVEAASEYAALAVEDTEYCVPLGSSTSRVLDRTRGGRAESQITELLETQEPDLTDDLRTPAVTAAIATWSPFSNTRCAAARHLVRCADGTRRDREGNIVTMEVA